MPSWDTDMRSMDMETSPISSPAAPSATTANKSEPEPTMSIAESIKACVSEVLQKQTTDTMLQSGYIMDTNSGLYYHPTSGYYYDAVSTNKLFQDIIYLESAKLFYLLNPLRQWLGIGPSLLASIWLCLRLPSWLLPTITK